MYARQKTKTNFIAKIKTKLTSQGQHWSEIAGLKQ